MTYLGGSGDDQAFGVAIAGSQVWVTGVTDSTDFDGPTSSSTNHGGQDAFLAGFVARAVGYDL